MKLSEAQREFTHCAGLLIVHIYDLGHEATFGDAYRDPRVFGAPGTRKGYGRSQSNHKRRLALDLNLFINGKYQRSTKAHKPIGEWWEALGEELGLPLCWGGRFNDGNHYSFAWKGYR